MREKKRIKESYITITHYCGLIVMFSGIIILLPILAVPFYPHEFGFSPWFVIPGSVSILLGISAVTATKHREKITVSLNHSAIIIVFAWLYSCILGGVPFVISGGFNWLQALFESFSGWTGTGLTVVTPEETSRLLLLWRSITQYVGSAGFAVVMLSILTGPSAVGIYQAEGHNEIMPHVKQSAKLVVKIYLFYLLVGSIAYVIVGMSPFDSINHCMTALGTGGFSTRNGSIGSYNSLPIEIVTIVLMIIGGTSFAVHHYIFQKKWHTVFKNCEVKSFFATLAIIIPLTIPVLIPLYGDIFEAIRKGVFETVSSMTGTGFSTVTEYNKWPQLAILLSVLAMCAGGMTNSTSGAIKQLRVYMMFKSIWWMIKKQFIPATAVTADYIYKSEERTYIKASHIRDVFNYTTVYVLTLIIGTCILMTAGFPMHESLFEFASAQGCVGQSIGITSYSASPLVLITLIAGMFFGRLEFFIIVYCFIKIVRDIRTLLSRDK